METYIASHLVDIGWTVFGGLALAYMKDSIKTRKEIAASLKRLEILFDVKVPAIEKRLDSQEAQIISLQAKINRR